MTPPDFFTLLWRRLCNTLRYGLSDQRSVPLHERFATVYRDRQWSGWSGRAPVSGKGSTLEATAGLREGLFQALTTLCPDRDLLRIVDAPCGDMTWMPALLERLASHYRRVEYTGIDIVPELVAAGRALVLPTNATLHFECLDITRDPLPPGDVVLCRDLLNHLFNADIRRVLDTVQASGCRYAIMTSNSGHSNQELNLDSPGASRNIDLQAPPFALPPPLIGGNGGPAVWRLPFR